MQTHTVFKINRAGQGYVQLWPGQSPLLDLKSVDEALPPLESCASAPCVAYAAARPAANQVILVVGSYWPHHRDEYGRLGLSFWHGILCHLPDADQRQVVALSNLLTGLGQRYERDYEEIGQLIATAATEKQVSNLAGAIARLAPQSCRLDYETRRKVRTFGLNLGQIPKRANLKSDAPGDGYRAIPYLLTLLLGRKGVKQVAGGRLSPLEVGRYRYISVPARVAGYPELDLAKLPVVKKAAAQIEARPRRRIALSGLAGVLGGVILAIFLLGFSLYFLLPLTQPTSTPSTAAALLTDTPASASASGESGTPIITAAPTEPSTSTREAVVTPTMMLEAVVTPTMTLEPAVTPTLTLEPAVTPTITLEAAVIPTLTLEPAVTPTISSTYNLKLCANNKELLPDCRYEHVIVDQNFDEDGNLTISWSLIPTSTVQPSNEEILIFVDETQIFPSDPAEAAKSASFEAKTELKPGQHKVIVRYGPNPDAPEAADPVEVSVQILFRRGG